MQIHVKKFPLWSTSVFIKRCIFLWRGHLSCSDCQINWLCLTEPHLQHFSLWLWCIHVWHLASLCFSVKCNILFKKKGARIIINYTHEAIFQTKSINDTGCSSVCLCCCCIVGSGASRPLVVALAASITHAEYWGRLWSNRKSSRQLIRKENIHSERTIE